MTQINNNNVVDFASLGIKPPESNNAGKKELGQEDFLTLMIAQLRNQDPSKPQEADEFLGQMAQFSTVEGIGQLNKTFNTLASSLQSQQALQASALVGHAVEVPGDTTYVKANGGLQASVEIPSGLSKLKVNVYDASGTLVRSLDLGNQPAGEYNLQWDGKDTEGKQVAAGNYRIEATGFMNDGTEALKTNIAANVDSVTLGSESGLLLNLAGVGSVPFTEVKKIN